MKKLFCDRCGFEEPGKSGPLPQEEKVYGGQMVSIHGPYDLCYKCIAALRKFVENRPVTPANRIGDKREGV